MTWKKFESSDKIVYIGNVEQISIDNKHHLKRYSTYIVKTWKEGHQLKPFGVYRHLMLKEIPEEWFNSIHFISEKEYRKMKINEFL